MFDISFVYMYKAHDHRQMNEKYMIAKRILLRCHRELYSFQSFTLFMYSMYACFLES